MQPSPLEASCIPPETPCEHTSLQENESEPPVVHEGNDEHRSCHVQQIWSPFIFLQHMAPGVVQVSKALLWFVVWNSLKQLGIDSVVAQHTRLPGNTWQEKSTKEVWLPSCSCLQGLCPGMSPDTLPRSSLYTSLAVKAYTRILEMRK